MRRDQLLPTALLITAMACVPVIALLAFPSTSAAHQVGVLASVALALALAGQAQAWAAPHIGGITAAAAISLGMGMFAALVVLLAPQCPGNDPGYTNRCTGADTGAWVVSAMLNWVALSAIAMGLIWAATKSWKLMQRASRH